MTLLKSCNSNCSNKVGSTKRRRGRPPASSKLAFSLSSQHLSNPPSTFSSSSNISIENFHSISAGASPRTTHQNEIIGSGGSFSFFSDLKDTNLWPETTFAPAPSLDSEIKALYGTRTAAAVTNTTECQQVGFISPIRRQIKSQTAGKQRQKKWGGFATDIPASKRRPLNPHITWSNPELGTVSDKFFNVDFNFDDNAHFYPFSEPNPDDHSAFSLLDSFTSSQDFSLSDPILPSLPEAFNCRAYSPEVPHNEIPRHAEHTPCNEPPCTVSSGSQPPPSLAPTPVARDDNNYAASSPIFQNAAQAAADFYGNLVSGISTEQTTDSIYRS